MLKKFGDFNLTHPIDVEIEVGGKVFTIRIYNIEGYPRSPGRMGEESYYYEVLGTGIVGFPLPSYRECERAAKEAIERRYRK